MNKSTCFCQRIIWSTRVQELNAVSQVNQIIVFPQNVLLRRKGGMKWRRSSSIGVCGQCKGKAVAETATKEISNVKMIYENG